MFALTAIKGMGRRFSNVVLKKADVNLDKRAGECSDEEVILRLYAYQLHVKLHNQRSSYCSIVVTIGKLCYSNVREFIRLLLW